MTPPIKKWIASEKDDSYPFGAIALAAYKPVEALFARQLLSIQGQTLGNFICIIAADGEPDTVSEMVHQICGDDDRFRVVGYEKRMGFHHNFERALTEVPEEAEWVALSDQDDFWYPEKLASLMPLLKSSSLAFGQARVVSPSASAASRDQSQGNVTRRRSVPVADMIASNQVTGSLCVFRRSLLSVALPFPSINAPSQYHDHWIGLCALSQGGIEATNLVLQDYIQHGNNVVGESTQSLSGSIRNTFRMVRRYERNSGFLSFVTLIFNTGLGWRLLMARTLVDRIGANELLAKNDFVSALEIYANPKPSLLLRSLFSGLRRGNVSNMRILEISLGLGLRPIVSRTRRKNTPFSA